MSTTKTATLSSCWHCSRAIWWRSSQWVHANGSAHCYSSSGERLDAKPRPAPCTVCLRGFSLVEWDNRHTNLDDGVSDIHAECCRECERPSVTENTDEAHERH